MYIVQKRTLLQEIVIRISSFTIIAYFLWRIFLTLPFEYGFFSMLFGVILLVVELLSGMETIISYIGRRKAIIPELPEIEKEEYPHIDILIATHNESAELLYKTVNACNFLKYPNRGKVHTYICDDGCRDEIKELAERMNVGYIRAANNKHAKAGNLNNALKQTNSPLVVTVDADMILRSEFLLKTVPYFFIPVMKKDKEGNWIRRNQEEIDKNEKIGFIQTPQSFYNLDPFQYIFRKEKIMPSEQHFFFRVANVERNFTNAAIYAGSNTVISRQALEEIGYLCTDSITEDFLTGLAIQKKGYSCYAIPNVLAHGLAPDTIESLISQRERWGRGGVQSIRSSKILTTPGLSFWARLKHMSSLLYWLFPIRRIIFMVVPIITVLLGFRMMNTTINQILLFWVPYFAFINITFYLFTEKLIKIHWANVMETILSPYLFKPILLELFGIKKKKFVVTNKTKNVAKNIPYQRSIPYLLLLFLTIVSILKMIMDGQASYNVLMIYWMLVNCKNLIYAIIFTEGRGNYRKDDRLETKVATQISLGNVGVFTNTMDLSDKSILVEYEPSMNIKTGDNINVKLKYEQYEADLKAEMYALKKVDNKTCCVLLLKDIDEDNLKEYYQIIYDRGDTLPQGYR